MQRTAVVTTSLAGERTRGARWMRPLILGVLGALFIAASPAAGTVIHACYKSNTGALRFIVPRGHCPGGQTPISWNIAGPAGARGPTGPAGFQGIQGFAGANGIQGANNAVTGVTGATGPTGATGAAGADGTASFGATGVTGAAGKAGAKGENGANGANGPAGPSGATGELGGKTPAGPTGATGAPRPATLPPGDSETGAWAVATSKEPQLPPKAAIYEISFAIPLPEPLDKEHVHYIMESKRKEIEEGLETEPGCKAVAAADPTLLEKPLAEPGNLCVYAGKEITLPSAADVSFQEISNLLGEAGASTTGAGLPFQALESKLAKEKKIKLKAQGTWAVAE